ncbi:palindromic element RPE4 domain-containing protein [Rickettsia amblyommatis]
MSIFSYFLDTVVKPRYDTDYTTHPNSRHSTHLLG